MNKLRLKLKNFLKIIFSFLSFITIPSIAIANDISIEIDGNTFTDDDVIISLIEVQPTEINEDYSNYLLKTLDNSLLFENVSIKIDENKYIISIVEYPNINKIYFKNNDRLDDDELLGFTQEIGLSNLNPVSIKNFISELEKIYESFGYNNSQIIYKDKLYEETNTADLYFEINEGEITKIKNIFFRGNSFAESSELKSIIKSKTKTLINIFANNNFKKFVVDNDLRLLSAYYKNNGYIDVDINYSAEYLASNKVNIYFTINEGNIYTFDQINFLDEKNVISKNLKEVINSQIEDSISPKDTYSLKKVNELKNKISNIMIDNGLEFFEISTLDKINVREISILYNIKPVKPKYANQINFYGNSRTFDRVIRRELEISEGDAVYSSQIEKIQNKLNSLKLFKSVEIVEKELDDNLVNLEINVEETQTGTFNAGVSVGTFEGVGVVAGLSERNFYGTGRSLQALINTTDNRTSFTFETTDRLLYENDMDITYRANFKQEDFALASSYKLDTFLTGIGIGYKINDNLKHNVDIDYIIKDYKVTDSSTVASAIGKSSGENVSFVLKNNLFYNTLNSLMIPKNGQYLKYTNSIETPTSSSNGSIKNVVTFKNYKQIDKNIIAIQARAGNIISLNDNDILTDDKFSLGGRWLRGFDTYGAGPRNSRTSYVGGNNLIVTKFDYSRELSNNSDFPVYLNLFNDYGLVWENKTTPTNSDNSLRSSAGFGIKYYSPIGPIGFTWGFPILDEEYDIKRMFLFSVGSID